MLKNHPHYCDYLCIKELRLWDVSRLQFVEENRLCPSKGLSLGVSNWISFHLGNLQRHCKEIPLSLSAQSIRFILGFPVSLHFSASHTSPTCSTFTEIIALARCFSWRLFQDVGALMIGLCSLVCVSVPTYCRSRNNFFRLIEYFWGVLIFRYFLMHIVCSPVERFSLVSSIVLCRRPGGGGISPRRQHPALTRQQLQQCTLAFS